MLRLQSEKCLRGGGAARLRDMSDEPHEILRDTRRGRTTATAGRLLPVLRASSAGDRARAFLQQCELPEPVCERMTGGGCGMSKKNMRRISILVTAQTAKNLERLASIEAFLAEADAPGDPGLAAASRRQGPGLPGARGQRRGHRFGGCCQRPVACGQPHRLPP